MGSLVVFPYITCKGLLLIYIFNKASCGSAYKRHFLCCDYWSYKGIYEKHNYFYKSVIYFTIINSNSK